MTKPTGGKARGLGEAGESSCLTAVVTTGLGQTFLSAGPTADTNVCPTTKSCHFSSTDQYAVSRKVFHDWYLRWVSFRFNIGLRFGFSGLRMRRRWASLGVRPPF